MPAPKGNHNTLGKHWKVKDTSKISKSHIGLNIWSKGRKLSEEHKRKIKENNCRYWLGKDRGGKFTKMARRMKGWISWREWREKVFERDNWTCLWCGQRGNRLEPHHIIPTREDLTKIFDVDNGITLCYECHRKTIMKEKQYEELFKSLI
jgi:hypothetical protein